MAKRLILITLLAIAAPRAAAAQSPDVPRVEIGGQGGAFVLLSGDGGFFLTAGPSLSVAALRVLRVELKADALGPVDNGGLTGLYQLQVAFVTREGGATRATLLVNVGVAGIFEYDRHPESRQERPDGSVVVYHAHSTGRIERPQGTVVGFAVHRPVATHAAIRWDVQGVITRFGVIVKTAVGVSFPIGGRYAR